MDSRKQPPAEVQDIGPEWKPCRKRPVIVHVREQRPDEQHVSTREGITPVMRDDLIIRGVEGEEYPIGRELFAKTYDMVPDANPAEARKGNTPIAELIADYESNGCDHSDMAWVKRAALHYVDTMQDSQVRCLLYTLASPPAEAQPCGCGEATCAVPWEPGCGLGKSEQHAVVQAQPVAWLGADPRTGVPKLWFKAPAPSVIRDFAMRPLYAHPPPSAPVGVAADILRIVDTAIDVCNDRDRPAMAEDLEAVRIYVEQASAALAHQPATVTQLERSAVSNASAPVGVEGWRVEPVEDAPDMLAVETPDGRTWFAKRGDRVFELAEALALAQQPAAVDEAMVERGAKELRDLHRELGDGADLPEKIACEIAEAVVVAALAAQQGGRIDD